MPVDAAAAKAVFLAALDHEDREAYLDTACAADPELRARVEELLEAFEAGSFPDYAAAGDETRTAAITPDDPTRTGGGTVPADGPDLSFLDPPREAGHLGRLDHYEVLSVIGQGGMGIVFRAHDESLDRVVTIKVLAPQYAANAAARKRFIREAKAVAAVVHDHVVAVHEVDQRVPYVVMQFIPGCSLQDRIDRAGPLPVTEVLRIGLQIARGLDAAHKQGLVHRDIKPSNVLLENGVERVKITDFGLARAVDDASVTQSGVIAGTPLFMSPEQARGEPVDPRSDLFSLGSVLYAMCTGRPPFRASGTMAVLKRVIEDTPRPPSQVNPDVADWLEAIILKLLMKDPADRFWTAEAVGNLLERHLAHLQHPDRAPMPARVRLPDAPKRPASRWRWVRFYWIVVLPIIAVVLMWRTGRPNSYLLVETDIPGLEVQVGNERFALTANEVREPFRASEWATGATLLKVPPGAYKVQATVNGYFLDEQTVVVVDRETTHVAFRRPPPSDWRAVFNLQNLTGWSPHPDQPGNWSVDNAVLTGRAPAGTLMTDRGDFRNFHLRLEAQVVGGAEALLCVRAPHARKTRFGDPAAPDGYPVMLYGTYFKDRRIGTLPGLAIAAHDHFVDGNRWFQLEVIADGPRIVTKVNDLTVVDFTDPKARFEAGHIALHLLKGTRGTAAALQVRRLEIKELPAMDPTPVPGARPFNLTPPKLLQHLVGTWEARPTEGVAARTVIEPVAGGNFVRIRTRLASGGPGGDGLAVLGFDGGPGKWEFRYLAFDGHGRVLGPLFGRLNAESRTLDLAGGVPPGAVVLKSLRFPAADEMTWEVQARDPAGRLMTDPRAVWRRVGGPTAMDEPPATEQPKEMAVLDRLLGTWQTDMTSRVQETKWKVELIGRPVLGGRFVETFERVLPSGEEHYTLYTYDPMRSAYRSWYVSSRFEPSEGTGTWDEAAKSLTWSCQGGSHRTAMTWTFATADRIDFRLTVTEKKGGTVVEGIDGAHTRKAK